ncbi:UDP-glucose dehydrogenase family protein, partial [Patescibacteria group bacterium]
DMVFIAVGTPMGEDGSADLQHVLEVAKTIGREMIHSLIIVDKSTVPIGTASMVRDTIQFELKKRDSNIHFDVVSNPEFLAEGHAVEDFMKPSRVVIGADNPRAMNIMEELYAPFTRSQDRFIEMDIISAEMTKYVANAMLATRISFMNEIAGICELAGANVDKIRKGIGSDSRIGGKFLYAGPGFGGSCFPKDLRALEKTAVDLGYHSQMLRAVIEVNERQKKVVASKVISEFGDNLSGNVFAVWGLAFKRDTDDMRESPAIDIINEITKRGAKIQAYDPKAMWDAKNYYFKENSSVAYFTEMYAALDNADALIIITEWREFESPDFKTIKKMLNQPVIIDGRNLYDPIKMKKMKFRYLSIGRPH